MTESQERLFEVPGPGAWEIESTHYQRPVSKFAMPLIMEGFAKGFKEGTERYGLLLSHLELGVAGGFIYQKPIPFGAPPDAKGPPPKLIFQLLTRVIPSLRRRIRRSHEAFAGKVWREDLERWDREVKPAAVRAHKALQAIDPKTLDDAALVTHIEKCSEHFSRMIYQHHQFTITCTVPVGDLLAHVSEWTGKSTGEILRSVAGSSKISLGFAQDELEALASAIRDDSEARQLLEGTADAPQILERLQSGSSAVSTAFDTYIDGVGYRCLGYDVSSQYALEMPEILVGAIRSRLKGGRETRDTCAAATEALRAAVPEAHRARFDELLGEARFINRLRDERGHYSDGWAAGIARRALLEAGRRLVEKGALEAADHAVDATTAELAALLKGGTSPSKKVVADRVTWRTTKTTGDDDVPAWLGGKPSGPPPVEWLPEHGRRAQRATNATLGALFDEPKAQRTSTSVKGLPVSPGVYEGTARLVSDEADFGRIQQGDVLVTRATSPYFNVVLPMLGAIVTDRGGQLCHAAIVSREYGIPGVVGTREATKLIRDGARVRVDGTSGEVLVVS